MNMEEFFHQERIPLAPARHHHSRKGWLNLDCPFCSKNEKRWRLGYNINGDYFSCWTCGPKQTVATVALLLGLTFSQAKQRLSGVKREKRAVEKTVAAGVLKVPVGVGKLLRAHKEYLRERKFDPKQIQRLWGIGGIGIAPRLQWRLYLPIVHQGVTVSWTTRSLDPNAAVRYVTARPEEEILFHRGLLYGQDYCRTDSVVVHEGPTDVWRTGPGAVCTFGTNFSQSQVLKLSQFKVRCIVFDATSEGQRAAMKLVNLLKVFPGETYNVKLKSKDMGSATEKERRKVREAFLWAI